MVFRPSGPMGRLRMKVPGSIQSSEPHGSIAGGADVGAGVGGDSSVGDSLAWVTVGVGRIISSVGGIGVAAKLGSGSAVDVAIAALIARLAILQPMVIRIRITLLMISRDR